MSDEPPLYDRALAALPPEKRALRDAMQEASDAVDLASAYLVTVGTPFTAGDAIALGALALTRLPHHEARLERRAQEAAAARQEKDRP